jgi:hypothetical protein
VIVTAVVGLGTGTIAVAGTVPVIGIAVAIAGCN